MIRMLVIFAAAFAVASAETGAVKPPDSTAVNKTDSAAFKTADTTVALPDTSARKPDSLTQSKNADTTLMLAGRHGIGVTAAFFIGIIPEFAALRSDNENAVVKNRMDQDPQEKFDENEICVPLGGTYRYRFSKNIQLDAGLVFYRVSNAAAWTPRSGDTVYTVKQVNLYALNVLRFSAGIQVDIDPLVFTVDEFQRCFFALEGEIMPALLTTERTELGKKISATGLGYGGSLYLGVERILNERTSVSGELGYGLSTFSGFNDNGTVRQSDVRKSGSTEAYTVFVRHLSFRFALLRWF